MRLQVLGIGKIREPYYRDAANEYLKRVRKHLAVRVLETTKEQSGRERDLDAAYRKIRREHTGADLPVALDRSGQVMSSAHLAAWLEEAMRDGVNLVSFIIGGPHGLSAAALEDSRMILSLSAMTLPHQMVRLLLMEQIYRAMSIIRGEPYHK